jgi:dephospho-CoA kinase
LFLKAENSVENGTDKSKPPLVALTGGVGSGKSTALRYFAGMGAAVLDCDDIVHELLERDDVRGKIARQLKLEAIPAGGDGRRMIADVVFDDPGELERLEALIHPLVRGEIESWYRRDAVAVSPAAVVEIQMLFEADMHEMFDAVAMITAPKDTRKERRAPDMTAIDFDRRSARQLSEEEKRVRCDFVYVNDAGLDGLERFVRETLASLSGKKS